MTDVPRVGQNASRLCIETKLVRPPSSWTGNLLTDGSCAKCPYGGIRLLVTEPTIFMFQLV